jgi:riboflavin transporter FmnP
MMKLMQLLVSAMLVVVAIIHLLPLLGVLGAPQLASFYGLDFSDPNLAILMRHRAVLFGLMGAFFVYAAFKPVLQPIAFVAGFVSIVSFLVLAWMTGDYNPQVARICTGDLVALVALVVAVIARMWR